METQINTEITKQLKVPLYLHPSIRIWTIIMLSIFRYLPGSNLSIQRDIKLLQSIILTQKERN